MSIHIRSSSATLFFASSAPHRALASFPTRRSSDLTPCDAGGDSGPALRGRDFLLRRRRRKSRPRSAGPESPPASHGVRSEERRVGKEARARWGAEEAKKRVADDDLM